MRHFDIQVYGRVQGVGFRFAARKEARKLGLRGWVSNEMDGSVRAAVEGPEDRCYAFIRWCRQGPGYSWVERIEIGEASCRGLGVFSIR
ncbi:MAG: acylphosphatase [Bacteroidetes bacterium]|nr:MAG: acylphosphatase [Bacteroidota bacterium]